MPHLLVVISRGSIPSPSPLLYIDEQVRAEWKDYLQKLIKIWSVAEHSIFPKLSKEWREQILDKIIETREMPRDYYSLIRSLAYPAAAEGESNITADLVDKQIKLLLTKTLLVYERLNAFYKYQFKCRIII
jgi:hypothetical protein